MESFIDFQTSKVQFTNKCSYAYGYKSIEKWKLIHVSKMVPWCELNIFPISI